MSPSHTPLKTRRELLKDAGKVGAISALAGVAVPYVHAASDNVTRLALVGCGGRGTGATVDAMAASTEQGPIRLHAMVDVFEENLEGKLKYLSDAETRPEIANKVDVGDRKFIGFDGYKGAMDTLRPGDVVILTTPCAFRWVHFKYAIEKGLNVFMEKPLTVDGPSTRKMFALNEEAKKKNLKVAVGLMCRHCEARGELQKRIFDGAIGDITLMRAYRMQGPVGSCFSTKNPGDMSELMYQIKRFHSFLWLSGGSFSDFMIHNIDECCMMKDAWPVKAQAIGGRTYRGDYIDQNFDSYAVEYTFADGTKLLLDGRNMTGCHQEFASYAHGTKGSAVISTASHSPARCRIYKTQNISDNWRDTVNQPDLVWGFPQEPGEKSPYKLEWEHFMKAIREDEPYNEADRGLKASLVTSMGRMAAHTGQVITYDQILNSTHEFSPINDQLTLDSDSYLMPDAEGKYPIPQPGIVKDIEYKDPKYVAPAPPVTPPPAPATPAAPAAPVPAPAPAAPTAPSKP